MSTKEIQQKYFTNNGKYSIAKSENTRQEYKNLQNTKQSSTNAIKAFDKL